MLKMFFGKTKRNLNYSEEYKCIFIHIPKTGWTSIESVLGFYSGNRGEQDHWTIAQYKKLLGVKFDDFFSFTVVRNPWDRAVSGYLNVKRDLEHQRFLGITNPDFSFLYFLTHHADCIFLRPQIKWIFDDNKQLAVDMVCRFENLQEDFRLVCDHIGLHWIQLPHLLKSWKASYRDFYTSSDLIGLVACMYAYEINFFWYSF